MLQKSVRVLLIYFALALAGQMSGQTTFNYAEVLQKSMFFYEAQQSGRLPATNRVSWRGDSALNDGKDVGLDLTGGWFDAGDHVKFGFPMAFSTTALAWGAIDFRDGYVASGQLQALKNNLRFVNDYFIKAHSAPNVLWGQVGDGGLDHAFWGSPEILMMARPSFKIDTTRPGSDLAAETAAAMAASSIVFAQDDPAYSATLLRHAKELYNFADNFRGVYSTSITAASGFYTSFSGFNDELVWGAIWLYRATGDTTYLDKAEAYYANLSTEPQSTVKSFKWTLGWDDKAYGCYVLLAKLTGKAIYKADAENNLDYWTDGVAGQRVRYSPGGLAFLDVWGSLRYSANAAFLALYYSDIATTPAKASKYYNFGVRQINYILGANPSNRSYVVGFGNNPPKNPHHRGAHGAWANNLIGPPTQSRHIIYGALVGGPGVADDYEDDRGNFQKNEVATDFNALFSGAVAKLADDFGGTPLANFPVRETPTDEFFIEAKFNATGTNFSEYSIWANNHTAWPARIPSQFKFRVFIDISEGIAAGFTPASYTIRTNGGGVTFTPLQQWIGTVYYTEVTYSPTTIIWPGGQGESRKESQIRIGLPDQTPPGAWNAANDPSNLGLDSTLKVVTGIPLYADGLRVSGVEPPRTTVRVTGVTVAPGVASVRIGSTTTLSASVLPANASNTAVTWSSADPAIATVNASGVVTGVALGSVRITATTVDGSFTAFSTVTVNTNVVPTTGVTVTPPTATVGVNSTTTLTATVAPIDASNKIVSWTSSNTAIATVNGSGVVTGVSPGTATITATTQSGAFTASSVVTVITIVTPVTLVTVTPSNPSVAVGGTAALTATIVPANATNRTVTWSSSNTTVATVSATGVVTGVANGTATITATAGGVSGTTTVTVGTPPTGCASPAPITLSFAKDGAGEFCYVTTGNINFINSWNMQLVEVNGVVFTNRWSNALPPKVNGGYIIHYVGTFPWSHLEINGAP